MNNVTISGRIVNPIEVKTAGNGTKYAQFTLADKRNKETTYFFDCAATGTIAENIGKYFDKGDQIIVNGSLQQGKYKDTKLNKITVFITAFDFGAKKAGKAGTTETADNADVPFDV